MLQLFQDSDDENAKSDNEDDKTEPSRPVKPVIKARSPSPEEPSLSEEEKQAQFVSWAPPLKFVSKHVSI